jgi:hypothetical protein
MNNIKPNPDKLFVEMLGYEYKGEQFPIPEIEGSGNIIEISKEYSGGGINGITVYCKDRINEFQKKVIQSQKDHFPILYFLLIFNNMKVIISYNPFSQSDQELTSRINRIVEILNKEIPSYTANRLRKLKRERLSDNLLIEALENLIEENNVEEYQKRLVQSEKKMIKTICSESFL